MTRVSVDPESRSILASFLLSPDSTMTKLVISKEVSPGLEAKSVWSDCVDFAGCWFKRVRCRLPHSLHDLRLEQDDLAK